MPQTAKTERHALLIRRIMPRKGRGDRDWQRYERDWKGYERYRRDEVNLYLTKARSLVESNPAPWTPQKSGQPPYPLKAMVTFLLLKTWLGMDYRSISAYLRAFPEQRIKIGLEETPSHTTIRSHMLRLPEAYLRRLNAQLTKPYQKGGLAADSTGFGVHRYETWLTVKGKRRQHRYLKLHILTALTNHAILNQRHPTRLTNPQTHTQRRGRPMRRPSLPVKAKLQPHQTKTEHNHMQTRKPTMA